MKVLITSQRNKEQLVQAFKDAGAEVVKKMDKDVKLIVPTVDEELPFFASAKEWFLKQGVRVMVNNPDVVDLCRNKAEFYRVCNRHGFAAPATMQDYFVVKPTFGKGGQGVQVLDKRWVVQEYVPFPEYSVDYFGDWEGKPVAIVQRRRLAVVDGESQDAKIEFNIPIYETVKRLGQELGLVGHNVIQGWYTGKTFILGEVNCRFGGGSHFSFPHFNSPRWLVTHE